MELPSTHTASPPLNQESVGRFHKNLHTINLAILATVAIGFVLWWLKSVLIPLAMASAIYFLMLPALAWLRQRWKIPRWAGLLLLASLTLLVLFLLVSLTIHCVRSIGADLETYLESLVATGAKLDDWFMTLGLPLQATQWRTAASSLPFLDWAQTLTGDVFNILTTSALTMIFLAFMLGDSPKRDAQQSREVSHVISRYLSTKILVSSLTGIGTGIVLAILNVDLAAFFGLAAFLLNFIPYIGSAIALLLPLPVVILQPEGGTSLWSVLAFPFVVQYVVANLIEPKLMGNAMGLSSLVVLLNLLFWGVLWGTAGIFMATPILSVGMLVIDRIVPGGNLKALFALNSQETTEKQPPLREKKRKRKPLPAR